MAVLMIIAEMPEKLDRDGFILDNQYFSSNSSGQSDKYLRSNDQIR